MGALTSMGFSSLEMFDKSQEGKINIPSLVGTCYSKFKWQPDDKLSKSIEGGLVSGTLSLIELSKGSFFF